MLLALVCVLGACVGGQTGSEGATEAVRPPAPSTTPPPADGPRCDDSACQARFEQRFRALRAPSTAEPRRLLDARCVATPDCVNLPATTCVCSTRQGGSLERVAVGGNECALHGRSLACLWPAAEVAACQPGSCDCVQTCERANALLDADDVRSVAVTARSAMCVGGGVCKYVLALDDRCYAGALPDVEATVLDCALSDDQLLTLMSTPPALTRAGAHHCGVESAWDYDQVDAGSSGCLDAGTAQAP